MSQEGMAILILLVSFIIMIFLRFPIAYAVALSSMLCLLSQGLPLTTICQQMVKGISSFSLMAVPFFITMGCLMGSGGISEKLIALANACVVWMTGVMAMVNIVASYFFGGISGSASADTASLGSILIPMMVDQGYDDDFSTAVTITSSCEGLLVPPSHNMVIYAMSAGGVSVGSLFLAGYVPGALLAISLNSTSKWKARVMPSLEGYFEKFGKLPKCITASFAFYIAFYHGQELTDGELKAARPNGDGYTISDDRSVLEFYYAHRKDSAEKLAHAVCANTDFWGKDLSAALPGFEAEVAGLLKAIEEKGTYAVMKDCL